MAEGSSSMSRRMAKCVLNYFLIHQAWQRSRFECLHVSSTSCHSASKQINLINKEPRIVLRFAKESQKHQIIRRCRRAMRRMSGTRPRVAFRAPTFYKSTIKLSLRLNIFEIVVNWGSRWNKKQSISSLFSSVAAIEVALCKKSIQRSVGASA